MEILIPGLILVALMVYASTKIKKNAARAYEKEIIETAEFSIVKPEGLINPLNDDKRFAFVAYSKDFGADGAENIRQATARVRVFGEADFDETCERAKASVKKIVSQRDENTGDSRSRVIAAESEETGAPVNVYFKIAADNSETCELRISVLSEHKDDYLRRIEEMIESFKLK